MPAKPNQKSLSDKARLNYSKVVESAELTDIALISSHFQIDEEYYTALGNAAEESEQLDFFCQYRLSRVSYNKKNKILFGQFNWKTSAKKKDTSLLEVDATYTIYYKCNKRVTQEAAKQFVSRVGRFATFPYFRSLVGFYSSASNAQLPVLPVLKD